MHRRTQYLISTKLEAIGLLESMSCREVARGLKVPLLTVRIWLAQRFELLAYYGNKKNKKLEPGGRYEEFPDPPGLVEFITHVRDNESALTTTHMIAWFKLNAAYNSLLKLLQRFCKRHGFSCQRPAKNKLKQTVLAEDCVFNVDETGMYYDLPPSYIWAVRGGSSKISAGEKHLMRLTAVRADRTKLPLMFIMRGTPGGRIESSEFPTFRSEHYYAVQTKAWMDGLVWAQYLREVLGGSIEEPSVVLMDNFECHVSAASYKIMYEELGTHLRPLPPNSTSVCQPLDVGVMAPFKRNLRNLWLLEEQIIGDDEDPYSLTAQQKRMAMVQRAISAWDMVSEDVHKRFARPACRRRLLLVLVASIKRPLVPDVRFNLDSYNDADLKLKFRFGSDEIRLLVNLLGIPSVVITEMRDRWKRTIYFAIDTVETRLQLYANAIANKGSPVACLFGFIDGSKFETCRITQTSASAFPDMQRYVYSVHKRRHCLNFQAITAPDNLCIHFWGPLEGARHDTTLLRESKLLDYVTERSYIFNNYFIYGDPAYGVLRWIFSGYKGNTITQQESAFKSTMSTVRQSMEWWFSRLKTLWSFVTFKM
ncbi:hypothetical protein H257_09828 [Aphanomyces astaci]|uniref:DDE Tnp4 domain-containing protein n=1 Tax=Aphanomyces astaci TaxID=112090 RepID=W4GA67_APHAT|nr:hypothetical protein H257_09828 [Aphanomyces astaci]ETV75853.1 hypothetical protein H257_09828 [Aphanomyces astaci]|eukprot:XP_009834495.1 hypothetical protein H257_09828 [Aphanomyces astaci]